MGVIRVSLGLKGKDCLDMVPGACLQDGCGPIGEKSLKQVREGKNRHVTPERRNVIKKGRIL